MAEQPKSRNQIIPIPSFEFCFPHSNFFDIIALDFASFTKSHLCSTWGQPPNLHSDSTSLINFEQVTLVKLI